MTASCRVNCLCSVFLVVALGFAPASAYPANMREEPLKLPLWTDRAPIGDGQFEVTTSANQASMTVYRPVNANGAAVIICPGGGYTTLAVGPEGHGIAQWLNGHGITGIVLEYRLPQGRPFVPLLDAQRALRMTRSKAREWSLDPNRIGIMGFSAGGHVASTLATHFDRGSPSAADAVERMGCRPDF